jgi:hypothetical protein
VRKVSALVEGFQKCFLGDFKRYRVSSYNELLTNSQLKEDIFQRLMSSTFISRLDGFLSSRHELCPFLTEPQLAKLEQYLAQLKTERMFFYKIMKAGELGATGIKIRDLPGRYAFPHILSMFHPDTNPAKTYQLIESQREARTDPRAASSF